MKPRPGRMPSRETAAVQRSYGAYSFPGPTLGWVSDHNLAMSQPGGAYLLQNVFPTATGGITRRGCVKHAETGSAVRSLFTFEYGTIRKMFAANDEGIFDVTISGLPSSEYECTNGSWITAQYTSSDGTNYLRGVNGTDKPFVYDGTSFDDAPSLTFPSGSTVSDTSLSYTWVFKNRFFFIEEGTLDVWYLPVGQIGGELAKFSLGGIFSLGGELVFGSTWSLETGDGLSSMCIFVTSNGEVAVYSGDNPGDAQSWAKVGIYQIGKPKGPRSFIQRGGDIVVATDIGFIAISQALQQDTQSLSPSAMSAPIEAEWNEYSRTWFGDWVVKAWTEGQMVAIALPTQAGRTPTWLVANARTGRWAPFTGWDASCLASFGGGLYYGSPDGNVYEANTGGSDDGQPYVCVWVPAFDQLETKGVKTVHMARAVMRARRKADVKISVHNDFRLTLPPPPPATGEGSSDVWGVGKWGEFKWGGGSSDPIIQDKWQSVTGEGEAITVAHQVTCMSVTPLDLEFIRSDATFTSGDMQV